MGYYYDENNWENGVLYLDKYLITAQRATSVNESDNIINGEYKIKSGTRVISSHAFCDIDGLESIIIPDSVISIGDYAFYRCENLETVTFPDSIADIGVAAFCECENLKGSIIIPNGVKNIELNTFMDCKSLESITLPDSVTNICAQAFYGCESLKGSIRIPNGVKNIEQHTFEDCKSLESITLPDSVTNIGAYAFSGCESLKGNIKIPNGVINIERETFSGCKNIESITLPDGVTKIGYEAFAYCENLKSIRIPYSITHIDNESFINCISLTNVYYDGKKSDWKKIIIGQYNYSLTNAVIFCSDGGINCWHTFDNGVITTNSSCMENGIITYTCTYCGEKKTEEIYATGHIDVTDKTVPSTCDKNGLTEGSHCLVCGEILVEQNVIPATGHSYDSGKVTMQPNCTSTGIKTYTCTECGETYIEVISALGHNYYTTITAPTCTEDGYTTYKCSRCNSSYINDYVSATGHSYDNGKVAKQPTCTSTGIKTYTCTTCVETKTEAVAKKDHTYKTTLTKATTSKNGSSVTKCTICGNIKSKSTIYYPKTITLSKTSYTYDGKVKKPTVTVKDSKGNKISTSSYTVAYSNNKLVGKASVKITFKGNYSGSKTLYFTIKPKSTSISKVTAGKKKFTVKWKKQSTQTTGYQIQYSTSSKFMNAKTVTVSKNKTNSKTISKLSAKKKYYVRIRTYKTVKINGKNTKIYSSWSKAKTVKTK